MDKDFKDKEFHLDEGHQNPHQSHELVIEENLNIDWFDDDKEEVKGKDGEKDEERGDDDGETVFFGFIY